MLIRALLKTNYFKIRQALQLSLEEAMQEENFTAAVCQMTSTNDKARNLNIVAELVHKAKDQNAQMVFLPEGCDYIASDHEESLQLAEEVSGYLMRNYRDLAKKHNIWISIGGIHEHAPELTNTGKIYNSHFVIDNNGEIKARYRKLHLFDVEIPDKNLKLKESTTVSSGAHIVEPIKTPVGSLGLGICYDLRFPEMSTLLRKFGATVLTYPSAFTHTTGMLHWEPLLRARAIENQCYVLAPAQIGAHNVSRLSHGHAMIIDPLGRSVGECSKYDCNKTDVCDPEIIVADLLDIRIKNTREEMPVFEHRRSDVYTLTGSLSRYPETLLHDFMFSVNTIPGNTVFYVSCHSFAFTNIRCVVPGHVLVATKRIVRKLTDLHDFEIADLFQTVKKVQNVVEFAYECTSSTIVVQDGKEAGQTVNHVHVHVLPRKEGDFKRNDDIYDALARHDVPETEVKRREDREMIREATMLREKFSSVN